MYVLQTAIFSVGLNNWWNPSGSQVLFGLLKQKSQLWLAQFQWVPIRTMDKFIDDRQKVFVTGGSRTHG